MTLNLVKLCVGAASLDHLKAWQSARFRAGKPIEHTTYQTPKRQADLLAGGSLYWVIKGVIEVRQPIVGFGEGQKDDGSPCCLILLDRALVPVRPTVRRAFQGWRYLTAEDAPPDATGGVSSEQIAAMTPKMRRELADLGLL